MTRHSLLALSLLLLGSATCQAQYQSPDSVRDHTWTPDVANMGNVTTSVPAVGTSAQKWKAATVDQPKPPVEPAATGAWKYAWDGRFWNKHTAGFVVSGAALGCYDNASGGAASASLCGAQPTQQTSCIVNGYGQGDCTPGIPFTGPQVNQTSYTPNTSFFWD